VSAARLPAFILLSAPLLFAPPTQAQVAYPPPVALALAAAKIPVSSTAAFVQEVKNVMVPIMEAIQKYGLKKYHLSKFTKHVAIFYNKVIEQTYYKSELCLKYQQRFLRYREPLFTFLTCDGIPWHNNTAESAIRHLPLQERISGVFHTSVIREYLILLGIRQTCRFQEKSFLKFLLSGEQDVDTFKGSSKNTTIRFPDELTPLWKKTAETL